MADENAADGEPAGNQRATLDLPAALRALRHRADLSQRELAQRAGVSQAQLARIESGVRDDPRLRTVERLVNATGARLAILDLDGTIPTPLTTDGWSDAAGRRFPAHLDPRPSTRWEGIYRFDEIHFFRNRVYRDLLRREAAGTRRCHLFTEIRRLGPRDTAALAILRSDAAQFDLAGRASAVVQAPDPDADLRYLRDPALRHWIAELGDRVIGHLIAYVCRRYDAPPALLVTAVGLRPAYRDGVIPMHLVAALCDEAAALQAGEIRVVADHPATAGYLRQLGFRPAPRRCRLLEV